MFVSVQVVYALGHNLPPWAWRREKNEADMQRDANKGTINICVHNRMRVGLFWPCGCGSENLRELCGSLLFGE